MNAQRWQQIVELYQSATDREPGARAEFLAQACQGDDELHSEVQSLLDQKITESGLLESVALWSSAPRSPSSIGTYRILGLIGEGGMGRVFLAEKSDQEFHRQVAIKLIKRGMDTDSIVRRFRNEREILASLDHPNIARLFDGGTSRGGLPYFVMEFIDGQPVDRFCDEHKCSITERLELFRKVCAAVASAHQHLVIHRDIKPSNILVTAEGVPKLLDFGIARLLRAGAESDTSATLTGLQLMTPEYASPEQVLGLPASTLTDIYSLGVVLYRLLTGAYPYTFRSRSPQEIVETICQQEPKRPSAAAVEQQTDDTARTGGMASRMAESSLDRVRKRLEGDLDNIVLMAMRKEPQRRYQSVEQFSEDIRRHLESLPVLARDDTYGYRLSKFTRRHRTSVLAGLLAVLLITAGVITSIVEARHARVQELLARQAQAKAERRFNDVRKLAHSLLFEYHDAIKNLPGATPVRERLVRDALQYLDSLAGETTVDRSLLRELASAYERVADVQGGTLEANLGDTAGAIQTGEKALHIRASLLAGDPQNAAVERELASSYFEVGTLLWETGDMSRAAEYVRQAVRVRESLLKGEPANLVLRSELASAYDRMGMLLLEQGNATTALAQYRKSLEIHTSASEAEQARESTRRSLSVDYEHIGSALVELDDLAGALQNNSRALAVRSALCKDFPLNADYQRTLQVSYYNQGEILARMGRTREALDSYSKDVALSEKLHRADPSNEQYRGDLAYGLVRVGDMLFKLRRYPEALVNYKRSQDLRSADVKSDPANLWKRSSLIEAKAKTCKTLAAAHQTAQAQEACSGALSLMQATVLDPGNATIRSFFADTYSDLAAAEATFAGWEATRAEERRNRWQSARNLYHWSLEIWQDLQKRNILSQADRGKQQTVFRQIAVCDAAMR